VYCPAFVRFPVSRLESSNAPSWPIAQFQPLPLRAPREIVPNRLAPVAGIGYGRRPLVVQILVSSDISSALRMLRKIGKADKMQT